MEPWTLDFAAWPFSSVREQKSDKQWSDGGNSHVHSLDRKRHPVCETIIGQAPVSGKSVPYRIPGSRARAVDPARRPFS